MSIKIDASKDCVQVAGNVEVPFVSRIIPQSVAGGVAGNEGRTLSGAEMSLREKTRLH